MPAAVIFDLDGVLLDSEPPWNAAREALARETGGRRPEDAPRVMMGMSSPEWSAYLRDELGVPTDAAAISRDIVRRMHDGYRNRLPLLPAAGQAVRALTARWPLGLASPANREIIDLVLELADFADAFRATVSSEEIERRKPHPQRLPRDRPPPRRRPHAPRGHRGLQQRPARSRGGTDDRHHGPQPPPSTRHRRPPLAATTVPVVGQITPALVEHASRQNAKQH
jgi:hypothetical protein